MDKETIDLVEWDHAAETLSMAKRSDGKRLQKWNDIIMESASAADSMVALHFDADSPFDRFTKQPMIVRDAPLILNCAFTGSFPFWQTPVLTIAVTTPIQALYLTNLFNGKKLAALCRPDGPSFASLKTVLVPLQLGLQAAAALQNAVIEHTTIPVETEEAK